MKSEAILIAIVVLTAVVGLMMTSASHPTGHYIKENPKMMGENCGPQDRCTAGYMCIAGRCQLNSGGMEVLPGQLCTQNTPCKYGYGCIDNRCQRVY